MLATGFDGMRAIEIARGVKRTEQDDAEESNVVLSSSGVRR
jgi:hypothetical protein